MTEKSNMLKISQYQHICPAVNAYQYLDLCEEPIHVRVKMKIIIYDIYFKQFTKIINISGLICMNKFCNYNTCMVLNYNYYI